LSFLFINFTYQPSHELFINTLVHMLPTLPFSLYQHVYGSLTNTYIIMLPRRELRKKGIVMLQVVVHFICKWIMLLPSLFFNPKISLAQKENKGIVNILLREHVKGIAHVQQAN
jgi:predicted neutral ceramidase superfamily lipid hydrolase